MRSRHLIPVTQSCDWTRTNADFIFICVRLRSFASNFQNY